MAWDNGQADQSKSKVESGQLMPKVELDWFKLRLNGFDLTEVLVGFAWTEDQAMSTLAKG